MKKFAVGLLAAIMLMSVTVLGSEAIQTTPMDWYGEALGINIDATEDAFIYRVQLFEDMLDGEYGLADLQSMFDEMFDLHSAEFDQLADELNAFTDRSDMYVSVVYYNKDGTVLHSRAFFGS